jgi:hypothetical protein
MKNNKKDNKNRSFRSNGGTDQAENDVNEALNQAFEESQIDTDQSESAQEPIYELSLLIHELKECQREVQENTVHTSAVQKVLLEHDLKPELVESTLDKIRAVDNQIWEDYDN